MAKLLQAIYTQTDLAALKDGYLHRAVRRHGGQQVWGRDAILAATLEDLEHLGAAQFEIIANLGDFVAVNWAAAGKRTRRHYWPSFEDGRIAEETIVDNCAFRPSPKRAHTPLGELASGEGQTGALPLKGFGWVARSFHALWNMRSLAEFDTHYDPGTTYEARLSSGNLEGFKAWQLAQFNAFPQSHVTIEREVATDNQVALLWQWGRINKTGMRDRVTGSTFFMLADGKICHVDMLIDDV